MILNNAPQNEAILSNVGEIGEFRIRNSAKAFNILSSGLYANKIRAVIRELSCNAVDSHVAAGKSDVPFDVHLPTVLEPHFSIRDYGTGLDHEQVTSIYTTYFESTKTHSNDFVGALGLGSKSPFSYTDNFTVTAIKDGRKGIYTAFINDVGVPSIALMMEEQTDEANGVEIKFSVNDKYDYTKFREETRIVYRYFTLKPNITNVEFTFEEVKYETRDLIPGVHLCTDEYRSARAIMGNIAYPIDVPNKEQLGSLAELLSNPLEIHFDIGELDFQASREGLSYIPQTIESIRNKLKQINDAIVERIEQDVAGFDNDWEKAIYLKNKHQTRLWRAAVEAYARKSNLKTIRDGVRSHYDFLNTFKFDADDLVAKYNMVIRSFEYMGHNKRCRTMDYHEHRSTGRVAYTSIGVGETTEFVVNDLKVGATERAKYHYRLSDKKVAYVHVIDAADREKPVDTKQFFEDIANPPAYKIMNASALTEKPRENNSNRNFSILKMVKDHSHRHNDSLIWTDAGKLSSFDDKVNHYYIPLKGYETIGKMEAKQIQSLLNCTKIKGISGITVYGVRKKDVEDVKKLSNWTNIEDLLTNYFSTPNPQYETFIARAKMNLPDIVFDGYNKTINTSLRGSNDDSPFNEFFAKLAKYDDKSFNATHMHSAGLLSKVYGNNGKYDPEIAAQKLVDEYNEVMKRYPLLKYIVYNYPSEQKFQDVVDYIDLIDETKGV